VENIMPAFLYLAAWFAMAGAVYLFLGIETQGRSIEEIDRSLTGEVPPGQAANDPLPLEGKSRTA